MHHNYHMLMSRVTLRDVRLLGNDCASTFTGRAIC